MLVDNCKKLSAKTRVEFETLVSNDRRVKDEICRLQGRVVNLTKAVEIVSEVSISAQHEVNSIIQGLVTKAVKAVYGNEFEFVIKDEVKRNQHETTFYILENGKSLSLDDDGCGGGLCDLVSLVLRVVLWAIQTPRTSPIFVLDEPLKGLDTNRLERAYVMIKELSDMLGVQFIIVTHQEMAIDFADVAYRVTKGRGESVVEQVK